MVILYNGVAEEVMFSFFFKTFQMSLPMVGGFCGTYIIILNYESSIAINKYYTQVLLSTLNVLLSLRPDLEGW